MKRERSPFEKKLEGFKNPDMSSCFINAPLLAILGPYVAYLEDTIPNKNKEAVKLFKEGMDSHDNNFYHSLIQKDYVGDGNEGVCDPDSEVNMSLTATMQEFLRDIYNNLRKGDGQVSCQRFRNFFSKCKSLKQMVKNQHDATEFYDNLLRIFGYSPMLIYTNTNFFTSPNRESYVCSTVKSSVKEVTESPSLYLNIVSEKLSQPGNQPNILRSITSSIDRLSDPTIPECTGVFINRQMVPLLQDQIPTVEYKQVSTYFLKCDTFVVNIDRNPEDKTVVKVPFAVDLTMRDFRDIGMDADSVFSLLKDESLDQFKNYKKQKYLLLSAVIDVTTYRRTKESGHFTTLLCVPDSNVDDPGTLFLQWLYYDDLKREPVNVTNDKAMDMISKSGKLLFYFPFSKSSPLVKN